MAPDRQQLQKNYGILGESPALTQALDKVVQVAPTDITVLLNGETGVGKDVTARAIHDLSPRKGKNLVIVNCGAIPEGIIESELFGHEKGAYTGAHEARMGYFEQADGGTIFLDEIVDTPKNVQVKLLRVLESGEFFRVGSSKLRKVDVRVIAASNKDMWKSVERGDFREDLYYRLNTVTIRIPPLRERNQDILLIFRAFVAEFAQKYDSVFRGMSDGARQLLLSYRWPGNIRELRNVAEQLVVLEKSQYVDEEVLKKYLKGRQKLGSPDNLPMVFGQDREHERSFQSPHSDEMHLIYRVLLDMKQEMGDMKKMVGSLLYQSIHGGNAPKSLPAASAAVLRTGRDPASIQDIAELNVGDAPYSDVDIDEEGSGAERAHDDGNGDSGGDDHHAGASHERGGHRRVDEARDREIERGARALTDDQKKVLHLFDGDTLPSLEEMEKFLIEQALDKFGGNRRKAARILGMSERTLYRKIDQYGLM
jgi:DNA-binding NtrC family response regulator